MTLSTRDRFDQLLGGQQQYPFDWVNLPLFFDPQPDRNSDYFDRLQSAVKFALHVDNEMGYGLRFKFRAASMSNGVLAYRLAEDYKDKILRATQERTGDSYLTTQNLRRMVAPDEMMSRVIYPNREHDFHSANHAESVFRDDAIIVPIEFENVPRTQKSNHALSQGASFQDWTFEHWWVTRLITKMDSGLFGGQGCYSRYGNMEYLTQDLIQCGFLDDVRKDFGRVPGKKFDITDDYGNAVSFVDRVWENAKHIVDVTERGFRADLAVAGLMAQFQLDDWLRGDDSGPLDRKKAHPSLVRRSKQELKRMDQLKTIMLPYITEKCLGWADFASDPHLKDFIDRNITDAELPPCKDTAAIKKTLWGYQGRGAYIAPEYAAIAPEYAAANNNEPAPRSAMPDYFTARATKRRSTEGHYFKAGADLFDDHHFDQLSQWEQAALPFAMGAIESFRLPENAPRSLFLIAEPKGGARAAGFMKSHKISWLKEAYSAEDQTDKKSGFYKNVIAGNIADIPRQRDRLAADEAIKGRNIKNIVTSLNFINIAKAAEDNRSFVAAPGPQKLSPRARLALMMEWMNRNSEAVALRRDWARHHDEVALATRALMIATGLVKRPYEGGAHRMEILCFDEARKNPAVQKCDLGDMILTLGAEVSQMLSQNEPPPAREHYVSMARMLQIFDMYLDPARLNYEHVTNDQTGEVTKSEIISWKNVEPSLMRFCHEDLSKMQAVKEMRDDIRHQLLEAGIVYFNENDIKGLGDDYKAAWLEARGKDAEARRSDLDGRRRNLDWKGPR